RMEICGLVTEKNEPVPLKSISVEVLVQDHVATVSSTLQYVNEEERPLEALFVFPLPADAAVCHFSAKIGEQEIVAEVQDRETARDRYDDAVSSGQQAFLLEESTVSPDVFRLSVGCLSAGQNAAVTIIYVTELAVQADHSLRFCLPAVLNPRYTPAEADSNTLSVCVCVCVATQGEFVFVIDRSGSMGVMMNEKKGAQMRIESAKDTLLLLLKSLPMGCYFNIYGFGSDFESFFPLSVEYNQDTMDQALKRVKEIKADMGGTEILQPLKHIYSQPCYPDHPRQLFVFTDGEAVDTKEVLDLVKIYRVFRCFSLGIGEGASAALITGMAREGSGHAQFITDTDRMQPKVKLSTGFHRFALQPAVLNISVDWTLPDDVTVDTLSPPINVLFQGPRTLIYAQLKGEGTVTVKYSLKDQPVTNHFPPCFCRLSIHRLAARTLIRSLEQKERSGAADVEGIRSRIVELSVQAGVSSVHTAFIAVNKDSRQTVKGPLVKRRMFTLRCEIKCFSDFSLEMDMMQVNYGKTNNNLLFKHKDLSAPELQKDLLLQLVFLQKASGCWDLDATLADVFGKTEDELTNQKPAQVDGSVWATLLALIWLYGCKIEQQVEWQFVAMKAASWIGSQKGEISIPDRIHSVSVHQEAFEQISSVL
uniref:von Willebrand factor A domain-containing protein 5A-like n=1 Tax=Sinocyclocheilus anshuiensis TaxID=1608454 RepID=A0A671KZ76_9TELE